MTDKALATRDQSEAKILEQVVIGGDLSKLSSPQRVRYYQTVCESIGLNPLTQPFAYLTLNKRLVLYARKEATDQLGAIRKISITLDDGAHVTGVYRVKARASLPDGRFTEATGAVAAESLKGEALANAMMKAETKAARRATLRLVGLGLLDESEVEGLPAETVDVDPETGEISDERALDMIPPELPDNATRISGNQFVQAVKEVGGGGEHFNEVMGHKPAEYAEHGWSYAHMLAAYTDKVAANKRDSLSPESSEAAPAAHQAALEAPGVDNPTREPNEPAEAQPAATEQPEIIDPYEVMNQTEFSERLEGAGKDYDDVSKVIGLPIFTYLKANPTGTLAEIWAKCEAAWAEPSVVDLSDAAAEGPFNNN